MCQFLSFAILEDKTIRIGTFDSHWGIEKGWNLKPGSYREAEWIENDEGESLTVRVSEQDILEEKGETWWKSLILINYPSRQVIFNSISIGKSNKNEFCFRNGKKYQMIEESKNKRKIWLMNYKYHRENGPAIEWSAGFKEWWINGKLHRKDGPAIEGWLGNAEWWLNGKRHRKDGPATEHANGDKEWWVNGRRHREDGPAIKRTDGSEEWWLNNKRHRKGGPAIIVQYCNGTYDYSWYLNGELHRDNGSAIESHNGHYEWSINGEHHRIDGPAVIYADGRELWFLHGKQLTEQEFLDRMQKETTR